MAENVSQIGEFGLIHRLDELLSREGVRPAGATLGIGDDTASFRPRPGWEVLITCDAMVEGRHYLPERTTPFLVGRRAMAINLSDIGAMGGQPLYALVSLGLRAETGVADVEEMYRGFVAELNPYGAGIIGGNITKTDHANFIDITLLGEAEPGKILTRRGARPGDAILVTGFPGQAAAGLELLGTEPTADPLNRLLTAAYREPAARVREGQAVARCGFATAMIDTSDGLVGDLGHICEGSRVGAELIRERLPVSEALHGAAARIGRQPWDWVLGDSDDYELVITYPIERVEDVRAAVGSVGDTSATEIGRVTDKSGVMELVFPGGGRQPLTRGGWDHFAEKGKRDG